MVKTNFPATENIHAKNADKYGKSPYAGLFFKFILLTMICSLVPLLMIGWGINFHYTRLARTRMINFFQTQIEYHRKIIELFLNERSSKLQLIAHSHSKDYFLNGSNLHKIFKMINRENWSIADLGIVDARGDHLAYIGPYDLLGKNFREASWFKEVMEKGLFISDMFMGFRNVPHFVIAVARPEKDEKWILRATVDTETFRSILEDIRIGNTGEVYLLNRDGVFQTSPRFSGKIMQKSTGPPIPFHKGIRIRVTEKSLDEGGKTIPRQIIIQSWLKAPRWLLAIKQNYSEAFAEVNHANYAALIFLHLSALVIFIVTVFITRHMISVIKKCDEETDQLNWQLLQTAKLSSIGEISVGIAHEINDPLAIILAEKQILLDLAKNRPKQETVSKNQIFESLAQIDTQIKRCRRFTQCLLSVARRAHSVIETVDINTFVGDLVALMERAAGSNSVKFFTEFEESLPPILSDPSQLQPVMLNLIANAIDTHDEKGYGCVHIRTRSKNHSGIEIIVADTGLGISRENMEKIFDPFYTTKPGGKGTGFGLSICYSAIKNLGGDIAVWSEIGKGCKFKILLPVNPPQHLLDKIAQNIKD